MSVPQAENNLNKILKSHWGDYKPIIYDLRYFLNHLLILFRRHNKTTVFSEYLAKTIKSLEDMQFYEWDKDDRILSMARLLAMSPDFEEAELNKLLETFTGVYKEADAEDWRLITDGMMNLKEILREYPLTAINYLKFFKVKEDWEKNTNVFP